MNAKQMLQMGGYPDTDEGRAAFYSDYPTKEAFMMKHGGQLSGAPHNGQPTAKEFFSWGEAINGPRGFYQPGGAVTPAMMMNSFSGPQSLNRNTYRPWTYPGYPLDTDTKFTDPKLGTDTIPNIKPTGLVPNTETLEMMKSQQLKSFSPAGSSFRPSGSSNPWGNELAEYGPAQFGGQPTAAEFFAWGEPIMGPQGFYQAGGSNSPLGYGAFPTMENGGTNTQDINGVTGQKKKGFMDYIQENVQNDQAKKQQAEMEQMMLQQYMMQGMMRYGGNLPKAQQMGQYNEDGSPISNRQKMIMNPLSFAGSAPSYNMMNDNDPRQYAGDFTMMNSMNPQGYGPGYVDPTMKPAPQKQPIDMNNIMMQGDNGPSVLDGTYSFMTKDAVNPTLDNWTPGGSNDVAFQNSPKETAQMAPTAAGDYDIRTGTSSDGNAYEVQSDKVQGELQKGRGRNTNPLLPYALLTGVRGATWLASGDERAREKEQMEKYMDPNYWAMSRRPGDRGNYNVNNSAGSHFRPNATGATVDPWGNANMKGQMGNPYYTAAEGGQMGGEVEMTDEEIQQFLQMGGQLEILD